MPNPRLAYLFSQIAARRITDAQREELLLLMADPAHEQEVNELISECWEGFDFSATAFTPHKSEELLGSILKSSGLVAPDTAPARRRTGLFRMGWIATWVTGFVLVVSVGLYFLLERNSQPRKIYTETAYDIHPGGDKAMLTLGNGRQLMLDEVRVGVVVHAGNVKIRKMKDSSLVYEPGRVTSRNARPEFNTISTPRGGKYKIILPDGSKVWLNASSSLTFPTRFTEYARTVELAGEAYLEVKQLLTPQGKGGQKRAFRVIAGTQVVEVLGTHFNINSYADDQIAKTTLLEGSILVTDTKNGNKVKLDPGQQFSVSHTGEIRLQNNADVEEVTAWKDNLFSFKNSDIPSVMKQISRWYNVDVQYAEGIPDAHLTGFISRNVPISKVLKMLEQTSDLKFQVEDGRRIIVSKIKEKQSTS